MFSDELEYKYRADDISLSAFKNLMVSLGTYNRLNVASWDVYFIQDKHPDSFQRLRKSEGGWELTKKVKTKDGNNWRRLESDLPIDDRRATEKHVAFHLSLDGYRENFRIYKHCDIAFVREVNYVYYVVYDENLREAGRFIEVEVNKKWIEENSRTETECFEQLRKAEGHLAELGLSPQNRLKKSLFELFRKL